tara:strand:- start:28 stop:222 length:195 start_codon:yes stop_codon:yes gene_type:complete
MKNKYEVAPGLYVGSEMGDLNRELKTVMKEFLEGNEDALEKINSISRKRTELLKPRLLRKIQKR